MIPRAMSNLPDPVLQQPSLGHQDKGFSLLSLWQEHMQLHPPLGRPPGDVQGQKHTAAQTLLDKGLSTAWPDSWEQYA